MSLASLKKCGPSVRRAEVTVDEFIRQAEDYAMGKVVPLPTPPRPAESEQKLKRATFTLGEPAIGQLDTLAGLTGIAKSRLIRIWLDSMQHSDNLESYLNSRIK